VRGALVEETNYYQFGLKQEGLSSKAAGALVNKQKTFQGQQFDDDLGINYDQFRFRNHDPQIGRFIEIDPLSEKYVYNSTYAFSENKVTSHIELEGLEAFDIKDMVDNDKVVSGEMTLSQKTANDRRDANARMIGVGVAAAQLGLGEIVAAVRLVRALNKLKKSNWKNRKKALRGMLMSIKKNLRNSKRIQSENLAKSG
jgi:RHS repeat-associated protein